jgi:hypothetical protein
MGAEDTDLARRAWRTMSELVHHQDRKVAVSAALGVCWPPSRKRCERSPNGWPPMRRT